MARAHTAKSILHDVQSLQSRVESCESAHSAHNIVDTTRENCLAILAREMELLKACTR